jgi:predicted O-methyltransferase YrrM
VVACKGELDALCALSHRFNAVAGAGTFKPEWARYLASLAPAQEHGVVVTFDGDEKGAQKAAPTLHEAGLDVRIASLPDGADVNDILVEGSSTDLQAHLAQADPNL